MRKLFSLYGKNGIASLAPPAIRGAGADAELMIYGVLCCDDADADWWGGVSAEAVVKALSGFKGERLKVRINSPGGDVFAGIAIAQALRETAARAELVAQVDGYAASAASVVAAAAPRCEMAAGAMLMIHNAWTIAIGDRRDMEATAQLLAKIDGELAQAYAKRAGGDAAAWAARMDAETWFTAEESVTAGLADAIAGAADPDKRQSKAWDFSAYTNPPAPPAPQPAAAPEPEPEPQPEPEPEADFDFADRRATAALIAGGAVN